MTPQEWSYPKESNTSPTWYHHFPFSLIFIKILIFFLSAIRIDNNPNVKTNNKCNNIKSIRKNYCFPKNQGMNIFGVLSNKSINEYIRWGQVGLLIDSLVTKHLWSHLRVNKIHKTKRQWTVQLPSANRLRIKSLKQKSSVPLFLFFLPFTVLWTINATYAIQLYTLKKQTKDMCNQTTY